MDNKKTVATLNQDALQSTIIVSDQFEQLKSSYNKFERLEKTIV
ncbi:hypothetical protein OF897_21185 [Chryseobacterium formosus]|uniref:Uncharacterized protein n=1 Tax=Chryseobacterium formosus TaxID=1537363 RepID=A0ABT3XXN9_9FLAO|nr:hypothetical protein [Chryseobacterium formosus]MCX8526436.1 hypothetical protein [Chryseobacterium formosus]